MKNLSKKGFTLVELIVVITILAILGTIAFLNFGQYTQDAKNTKVTTDLRNISSKITTVVADNNGIYLKDILDAPIPANKMSGTFNSGTTIAAWTNYDAGSINFKKLGEDGEKFKDNDGHAYVYAYAADWSNTFFQIAWNTKNAAGNSIALVDGHYYKWADTDVDGLIKAAAGTDAGNPVTNNSTTALPY